MLLLGGTTSFYVWPTSINDGKVRQTTFPYCTRSSPNTMTSALSKSPEDERSLREISFNWSIAWDKKA